MKQIILFSISLFLLVVLTAGCIAPGLQPLEHPKSSPTGKTPTSPTPSPAPADSKVLLQSNLPPKTTESGARLTVNNDTEIPYAGDHQPMVTLCINVVPEDGGFTTPSTCTSYERGTSVTLVAKPAPCHYFAKWGGDVPAKTDIKSSKITITMDKTKNIIASMPFIQYTLTVNVVGVDCSVTPSQGKYNCGSVVTLLATPEISFKSWSGDPSIVFLQNPALNLTMDSNKTLTATFYQIGEYITPPDSEEE